jgi:hypothetical protein
MVRRAAGSYRLGRLRFDAFLAAEAHETPEGGAKGFVEALSLALAPAAAAAPASAAAAAAAVTAAGALARALTTAPALPATLAELPALASAAAVAAATATLRPDRGAGGSKKIRAAPERWAAAAAHLRCMLAADVYAFARHAAFETAPHPFERLLVLEGGDGDNRTTGEDDSSSRDERRIPRRATNRVGSSFASEASLAVRVAALADAEKRLAALAAEPPSSSSRRESFEDVSARLASLRASLARLALVAAARETTPRLCDDALVSLQAAADETEAHSDPLTPLDDASETQDGTPKRGASFDAFFSSGSNAAARAFAKSGASAASMFDFEAKTRDARERKRLVIRRRPRASRQRARRDGGARRRRFGERGHDA